MPNGANILSAGKYGRRVIVWILARPSIAFGPRLCHPKGAQS
jgi:hypothetical protein